MAGSAFTPERDIEFAPAFLLNRLGVVTRLARRDDARDGRTIDARKVSRERWQHAVSSGRNESVLPRPR
jgi:hypothetical protein